VELLPQNNREIAAMDKKPIYTIGHGARKAEEFLGLLKRYGIEYLVDVRSQPFSRYHPQFSQNNLKAFLEENNVRYVFMGDTLGGRPKDPGCYDENGKINYEKVKTKDFFKEGMERLKTAYKKNLDVAIMCSERDPAQCHRYHLISSVLDAELIDVMHIDQHGQLKTQHEVM
jgi:uncharacterized protein (DUF488 family)